MKNTESLKLWVSVAAIILVTATLILLIDFKTKKDILTSAHQVHDDLEKWKVLHGLSEDERGVGNSANYAGTVNNGNGGLHVVHAPAMEEGHTQNGSAQASPKYTGDAGILPERNARIGRPGVQANGKRLGTRTVAKVPREEEKPKDAG